MNWTAFKQIIINPARVRFDERDEYYNISYFDDVGKFETSILRDGGADNLDFDNNYKNLANKSVEAQTDSDGSLLSRSKITQTGWHYQLHGVEFTTSTLNSGYSKKSDGADFGFMSMKFYKDVSGTETEITGDDLNQSFLNSNCIKTIVDWEPTHNYEMIGGFLKQISAPTESVRVWINGVPDISSQYGGNKEFVANVNLTFMGLEDGIRVDGRAPKMLTYSATYHTNKMRIALRHPAGYAHPLHMLFELFKP
jgi:hypothetical protein